VATPEEIFVGGGEMGRLMRSLDWAKTLLGDVETWAQSLRSTLSICLNSRFPIAIYWGADFLLLYNDAWRPIVGDKHPWAIGRPAREVWSEIWDDIGPELAGVLATGEGTFHNDELLSMHRFGYTEECFFEYTFNPIQGQGGAIDGVFNVVSETTYRVLNERRARLLRETAAKTGIAKTAEEAIALIVEALKSDPLDIPFALLYRIDSNGEHARLCGSTERLQDNRISPDIVSLAAEASDFWEIAHVARTAQPKEINDLVDRFGKIPGSPWSESPQEAIVLPIVASGQNKVTGVLVAVASPRRRLDDNYRDFFNQIATQIATAITNAQAYEAERKRAEALAELDRAKTTFFSNVSHEFRTPLTLMLGPLEELSNSLNGQLQPDQWEQLQLIQRNGLRLQKLVNTLLDFSRIEAGRVQASYEPTDLATYTAELASVFRSLIEQAGMALVIDCPALPEPVYVDRDMWEKIVLNLLSNAFKFTFTGSITIRLQPAGNFVELSVTDTGVGISEAELPRLFERFHRVSGTRSRTYEGSGIGLALVQELVNLHGGTIHVTSQVDCGTTFTIALPLGTQHLPQDRIEASRTLRSTALGTDPYIEEASRWITGSSKSSVLSSELSSELKIQNSKLKTQNSQTAHILLADDNADMRDYVKRLLSQDYEVETVSDGFAALEAMTQRLPDLVLSDVMMPRLDGFGLLRELRANPRTKEIPIILLSARAGEESRIEGLEAGADDYLIKPFSARELLARVEATLKLARIRKQAEITIREREERLKLALEAGRMIAWEWNPFTETIISTNLPEIYGIDTIESSQHGFSLIHPDDQTRHQAIVENAVGAGSHYRSEFRFIRPDTGEIVWMEERGKPVLNHDGSLQKLTGVTIDISDRKRIEEELRKSEQQLRSAIEVAQFSPYEWNPVTGELIWDAQLKAMWGLAPDAEVNLAVHDAGLHPQDREYVKQQAAKAIDPNGDGIYEAEFRVIGIEDGIERWISARGQTFFDAERRPIYYVGAAQDISDRKQAELEIQKFVSLANNSTEFIGMCDMNLIPFYVNEAGLQTVGLEGTQQFKDTPVQEFFFPEDQDFIVNEFFPRVLREGRAEVEIRLRHFKTGEAIWMIYNVFYIRGENNQPVGLATVSRNVTERKRVEAERNQAEATLRENEERFRTLAATVPQLIWTATPDGSVDYLSEQWADYIGLPPERLYDWNWQQVVHPDDLPTTLHDWQHSLQSGEPLEIQHRFRYHTGEWRWQLVRGIPVKDETGQVTKWVGTCTDIHESELWKQDAQFLSDLSEAIRTIDHADNLMTTAIEMIGQYLQLKRCYFAQTDEANDRAWITSDYHDDSLPSLVGEHLLSHYPSVVLELLRSGRLYISNDNKRDPRSVDCYTTVYEPLAIRAHVVVPFFMDGRWAVNLIAATNEPRQWQEREINLLETAAERIWLAVEKLRSEVALRESEDRYRALTELSPQLVFMSRADGFITYVNQWGLDFTGRSLSELQGDGWSECIHPEYRDRVYEAWMTATSHVSDYNIEILFRRADGVYRWLYNRALPVTNDTGEIEYWIGVAIDITDRKQAELALRESEAIARTRAEELEALMEVVPVGIWLAHDPDCRQVTVNRAAYNLMRAEPGDPTTATSADGVYPFKFKLQSKGQDIPAEELSLQKAGRTGQEIIQEAELVFEDGVVHYMYGRAVPLRNEAGNVRGVIGAYVDISERKQAEAEREQLLAREQAAREEAERANRIKDEFLAVLSHELRSPLNPILGWSRLLQNGKLDESKTKQALATIERNAKLQSELIEDLLDVSRILQGKLSLTVSSVNLASTIQSAIETVRLAAEAKSIAIETRLDPKAGLISGDLTRLQQVVWNLLSNAVKFTPIGGRVTVQLEQVNAYAQIIVRDTGKGISPDFLPYVFDYFRQADSTTTRKFGGLGLGLAIVRHLVELHGGTVRVESPGEGQGATFTVRLPLMLTPSNLNQSESLPKHPLDLSGIRILVVEDEIDARELLMFLLEQQGAQVIAATSAHEALLLLTQSRPNILISDIGMPDMDGYMLIQQVRKLTPEQGGQIPAIALTAYAGEINQQQALAAGFQKHISKPVEPEELFHLISSLTKA
jgi:PAS domain S-box-containing protein